MTIRPPAAGARPRRRGRSRLSFSAARRPIPSPAQARWQWAGLALAVAVGLSMLVRSCAEPEPLATALLPPPPEPAALRPPPPPPPKPPPAPAKPDEWAPQRKLLRDAVAARSKDLAACPLPAGSPSKVLARLRVARGGAVRGIVFANADPLPRGLPECLRGRMQAWTFADLQLRADVEVLVTFDLGPPRTTPAP